MVTPLRQSIQFELCDTDFKNLRASRESLVQRSLLYLTVAAIAFINAGMYAADPHLRVHKVGQIVIQSGIGLLWLVTFIMQRVSIPEYAREGNLDLDDSGLQGTLDGQPAAIPWRRMSGARRTRDVIVIARRRSGAYPFGKRGLAIPRRSLSNNGEDLWAALEAHLIDPRGLVRSTLTTDTLTNSAC